MYTVVSILTSFWLQWRSAWILKPDSLPKSYVSFLNKHGGKHVSIIKGINQLAFSTKPFDALKGIEEHYKSTGVDIQLDPDMSIPCSVRCSSGMMCVCVCVGERICAEYILSFLVTMSLAPLPIYYWVPFNLSVGRLWKQRILHVRGYCNYRVLMFLHKYLWLWGRWYMGHKDVYHIFFHSWDMVTCGPYLSIYLSTLCLPYLCTGKAFLQGNGGYTWDLKVKFRKMELL